MPQYPAFTVIPNAVKNLRGSGSRRLLFASRPYLTAAFVSTRYFACAQYDTHCHSERSEKRQSVRSGDKPKTANSYLIATGRRNWL